MNLVNRIRSMKRNMERFLFRCRENIATVPIDEYERVMKRVHALLEEEEEPLLTIQSLSQQHLEQLQDDRHADREMLREAQRAIREIIGIITLTIQEQRSLINRRTGLAHHYDQLLRDQMSFGL